MCREGAWDELAVGVTSGIAIRSGMLVKKDCIYKKSVLLYVQKKAKRSSGQGDLNRMNFESESPDRR